jgi:hypothetical protein
MPVVDSQHGVVFAAPSRIVSSQAPVKPGTYDLELAKLPHISKILRMPRLATRLAYAQVAI